MGRPHYFEPEEQVKRANNHPPKLMPPALHVVEIGSQRREAALTTDPIRSRGLFAGNHTKHADLLELAKIYWH